MRFVVSMFSPRTESVGDKKSFPESRQSVKLYISAPSRLVETSAILGAR